MNRVQKLRVVVCLAVLLFTAFTLAMPAVAQLPTGTILGSVKDPSGAVIAGAVVTVTNTDTSFTRSGTTGSDGSYRFPALPVGNYQVKVTHEGFQTAQRTGLVLEVAQEALVDLALEVGSTSQTVTVTEAAPLVDVSTSSVGGTVNEERVADLPLNGRNWTDLTLMQTGVSKVNIFTGLVGTTGFNGTLYSSNGATVRSNMYLLDGANELTLAGFNNTSITNTSLGVDGIKEYKVVTILPDAEYGLVMGSQTALVSKGGTNEWHGDAYDYLRNASLDARNYFDALDTANARGFGSDKSVIYPGKRIPPFRRNNFGGAFGGPIKKDKTFFFGVYEGIQQQLGVTSVKTSIPSACFVNAAGVLQPMVPAQIDNNSTKGIVNGTPPNPYGACAAEPAAPNTPANYSATTDIITVNPLILPFADLFPQPNVVGYPAYNYTFPYLQPTSEHYGQIRVDQNFSASDSAFFRYTQDDADQSSVYTYPALKEALHSASQFATVSETHLFSANLLNTFRFSVSRTFSTLFNAPQPTNFTQANVLLVSAATQSAVQGNPLSGIFGAISPGSGVSGLTTNPGPGHDNQDIFTWSDDVYWSKGKHAFKFGTLLNYYQDFSAIWFQVQGSMSFGSLANFYNGIYSSWNGAPANSIFPRDFHSNTYGFYAQDDYRATSRLTLNLGLRYEFTTVPRESNPALACAFRNALTDSACTPGEMFRNPSLHDFSPRFGFAWDPFGKGKTSIRGGAGLYYDIGNYGAIMNNNSISNPPVSATIILNNTSSTSNPVPLTVPFVAGSSSNVPPSPRTVTYNLGQQTMLQRALTIDQQLPWQMGLTVSYVGSNGWHLWQVRDGNPTVPVGVDSRGLPVYGCWNSLQTTYQLSDPTTGVCPTGFSSFGPRTNTKLGQVQGDQTSGRAYYNSLQVQLNKRITQGLQFQFNYTYSKLEDTGVSASSSESGTEGWEVPDGFNTLVDRGPAVYDNTHNIRVNFIYHLANFKSEGALSKLTNGWWVSSILTGQSGYPVTPIIGSDRALQNDMQQSLRPDYGPSFNKANLVIGSPNEWFNPAMFSLPRAGTLGNAGRAILRGPRLDNIDFSLVKDTKAAMLGEAGNIEFRAEIFNLLNHANFALPSASIYTSGTITTVPVGQIGSTTALAPLSTAGQITSTVTNSRQVQLALKVIW